MASMDLHRVDHGGQTSLLSRMKGLGFWMKGDQWVSFILLMCPGHLEGGRDRQMDGWMDIEMGRNWD